MKEYVGNMKEYVKNMKKYVRNMLESLPLYKVKCQLLATFF